MHILSPETDNCPSWISGRERMIVENISRSFSTKEYWRPRPGLNPRPPDLQSDGASNWATEVDLKLELSTRRITFSFGFFLFFFCISQNIMFPVMTEDLLRRSIWWWLCPPTHRKGDILILVQIPLALASHGLVCTISCETVVGFLTNFHGYIIGTEQRTVQILVTLA